MVSKVTFKEMLAQTHIMEFVFPIPLGVLVLLALAARDVNTANIWNWQPVRQSYSHSALKTYGCVCSLHKLPN